MLAMYHDVEINCKPSALFKAISTAEGFNAWWTTDCHGKLFVGAIFNFHFSEDYDWSACVKEIKERQKVVYLITQADEDWTDTILSFEILDGNGSVCILRFEHRNWSEVNDHFRRTNYCWAKYFLKLKSYLEEGSDSNV